MDHNRSDCIILREILMKCNRGIHADVFVYIFAHLHTTLRTDENLLGKYWLQVAKELVKLNTWIKF